LAGNNLRRITEVKKMTREERKNRLQPGGIPRYVRCYDNGGKSFDQYTVVYTGKYPGKKPFECNYVAMSTNPFHPQGFGQHGWSGDGMIDRPKYSHLGKRIPFFSLPENCQELVRMDYEALWIL
jgi:hypothetical protein